MRVAPPVELFFPAVALISRDEQQAAPGKLPEIAQTAEANMGKQQNCFRQALPVVVEDMVELRLMIISGGDGPSIIGDFDLLQQIGLGEISFGF